MPRKRVQDWLIVTESQHQRELLKWWALAHRHFGLPECALLKVRNEAAGSSRIAMAIAKAEGLRKGASDLLLTVARGPWHGMWIELKKKDGGTLSEEQRIFLQEERGCGFYGVVCHGWEDAKDQIEAYLRQQP